VPASSAAHTCFATKQTDRRGPSRKLFQQQPMFGSGPVNGPVVLSPPPATSASRQGAGSGNVGSGRPEPQPQPTMPASAASSRIPLTNPSGQPFPDVPPSPYDVPPVACAYNGIANVRGFPSSPFRPPLFTVRFANPPMAQPSFATCTVQSGGGQSCITGYSIDITENQVNFGLGCGTTTVVSEAHVCRVLQII
jgi:hypothetical protein